MRGLSPVVESGGHCSCGVWLLVVGASLGVEHRAPGCAASVVAARELSSWRPAGSRAQAQ